MGVYIPDMEMPTSCDDCPLGGILCCPLLPGVPALWTEYTNAVREKRLHSDCPLIPIPPHGDLVDKQYAYQNTMAMGEHTRKIILKQIDALPIIIPASGEDEHG